MLSSLSEYSYCLEDRTVLTTFSELNIAVLFIDCTDVLPYKEHGRSVGVWMS
jgi:hypothetical protein